MLGDYEKRILIPHHQWPQPQSDLATDDETRAGARAGAGMDPDNQSHKKNPNPNQIQNQNQKAQEVVLRCPRCDSSNTKFCYYNNYSLSQPRHFCKGCKRYWTRGGTLRNVPVGGGCRKKNKRVKKTSSPSPSPSPSLSLYSVPMNLDPNSNNTLNLSYDLRNPGTHIINGFTSSNNKLIFQDSISSSSNPFLMSNYTSMPSSSSNIFGTILPSYAGMLYKEMKVELEGQNRQMGQAAMGMIGIGSSSLSDPSLIWGGGGGGGGRGGGDGGTINNNFAAWLDPSNNLGSSVPSLI